MWNVWIQKYSNLFAFYIPHDATIGQVASPGYVIPSTSSIYPLPGGVQFPSTSNQIPLATGGIYPNSENYPGVYSQQGGTHGTPTDGSYSSIGTQGVPGIGQSSLSVPSAGNLVYGGRSCKT